MSGTATRTSSRRLPRQSLWLPLVLGLLLGAVFLPHLLWRLGRTTPLSVLIIDKTVPNRTFRGHAGLVWVLNHLKYESPSGPYRAERDYVGFLPLSDSTYRVMPIPSPIVGRDLVYLADAYGVTRDDLRSGGAGEWPSPLLYGGLTLQEATALRDAVGRGTTLIAEFNALANATGGAVRDTLSAVLGIRWSGWIGCHYAELSAGVEIPPWVEANYRQHTNSDWTYEGPGYVLARDDGRIVVLRQGAELGGGGLRLFMPADVRERYGTLDAVRYQRWFDIVSPAPGTEVIAEYRFDLTDAGHDLLGREGVPATFPSILRRSTPAGTTYYLAGDFADGGYALRWWRIRGLAAVLKYWSNNKQDDASGVYWRFYVPFMRTVLRGLARRSS